MPPCPTQSEIQNPVLGAQAPCTIHEGKSAYLSEVVENLIGFCFQYFEMLQLEALKKSKEILEWIIELLKIEL